MIFSAETYLWLAAAACAFTMCLHMFATKHDIVAPLLDSSIPDVSKYTHYYCWHMVTIIIGAMTVAYFIAARYPQSWELGAAATILAICFTVWSLVLVAWKKTPPLQLPQWILFAIISAFGVLGLV